LEGDNSLASPVAILPGLLITLLMEVKHPHKHIAIDRLACHRPATVQLSKFLLSNSWRSNNY
jgi:hypothetical protein